MREKATAAPAKRGHNRGEICAFDESARRIKENSRWLAGGVSSNFRLGMAPSPLVFDRGEGPFLYDVDGSELIDYYLGMGPMILGHGPAGVGALERGAWFMSIAHDDAAIDRTLEAVAAARELYSGFRTGRR